MSSATTFVEKYDDAAHIMAQQQAVTPSTMTTKTQPSATAAGATAAGTTAAGATAGCGTTAASRKKKIAVATAARTKHTKAARPPTPPPYKAARQRGGRVVATVQDSKGIGIQEGSAGIQSREMTSVDQEEEIEHEEEQSNAIFETAWSKTTQSRRKGGMPRRTFASKRSVHTTDTSLSPMKFIDSSGLYNPENAENVHQPPPQALAVMQQKQLPNINNNNSNNNNNNADETDHSNASSLNKPPLRPTCSYSESSATVLRKSTNTLPRSRSLPLSSTITGSSRSFIIGDHVTHNMKNQDFEKEKEVKVEEHFGAPIISSPILLSTLPSPTQFQQRRQRSKSYRRHSTSTMTNPKNTTNNSSLWTTGQEDEEQHVTRRSHHHRSTHSWTSTNDAWFLRSPSSSCELLLPDDDVVDDGDDAIRIPRVMHSSNSCPFPLECSTDDGPDGEGEQRAFLSFRTRAHTYSGGERTTSACSTFFSTTTTTQGKNLHGSMSVTDPPNACTSFYSSCTSSSSTTAVSASTPPSTTTTTTTMEGDDDNNDTPSRERKKIRAVRNLPAVATLSNDSPTLPPLYDGGSSRLRHPLIQKQQQQQQHPEQNILMKSPSSSSFTSITTAASNTASTNPSSPPQCSRTTLHLDCVETASSSSSSFPTNVVQHCGGRPNNKRAVDGSPIMSGSSSSSVVMNESEDDLLFLQDVVVSNHEKSTHRNHNHNVSACFVSSSLSSSHHFEELNEVDPRRYLPCSHSVVCTSSSTHHPSSTIFPPSAIALLDNPFPTTATVNGAAETQRMHDDHRHRGHLMDLDSSSDDDDKNQACEKNRKLYNDRDSSDNDCSSATSCELSFSGHRHDRDRCTLSSSKTLNVSNRRLVQIAATVEEVLSTITSYDDLKYIIHHLRIHCRSVPHQYPRDRNVHSAYRDDCTALPWIMAIRPKYASPKRTQFIAWTTSHLGFQLRKAGGEDSNSLFLSISDRQGRLLLTLLESSRCQFKQAAAVEISAPLTSINIVYSEETSVIPPLSSSSDSLCHHESQVVPLIEKMELTMSSLKHQPHRNSACASTSFDAGMLVDEAETETDLLTKRLENLTVEEKSLLNLSPLNDNGQLDISPHDDDRCPLLCSASSTDVYLPDLNEKCYKQGISFLSPRASYESSHSSASSLVRDVVGKSSSRRFRTSIGTRVSQGIAAVIGRSSLGLMKSMSLSSGYEVLHTPMEKLGHGRWGSQPVEGRDWGTSSICCESNISILALRGFELVDGEDHDNLVNDNRSVGSSRPGRMNVTFRFGECAPSNTEMVDLRRLNEKVTKTIRRTHSLTRKEFVRMHKSIEKIRRRSIFYATAEYQNVDFAKRTQLFCEQEKQPLVPKEDVGQKSRNMLLDHKILQTVFSFANESELLGRMSLVCKVWSDTAAKAHYNLMLMSAPGQTADLDEMEQLDDDSVEELIKPSTVALSMQRDWDYLVKKFPWGHYLAEGGMKTVYKVFDSKTKAEEAISVIDFECIIDKRIVAVELALSCLFSSLVRRSICANFVVVHGVFNSAYAPPARLWGERGTDKQMKPLGDKYDSRKKQPKIRMPKTTSGTYQYVRMELCSDGDVESYIKCQEGSILSKEVARGIFFQVAYALHLGAVMFSLKHYDMKNLNVMLQRVVAPDFNYGSLILRYGLGDHIFAVRMPPKSRLIAKIADFGTSNIQPLSNDTPVTIAQYTTIENTPPDYIILGDSAKQGHGHDNFGLGLILIHLFTGNDPYEEIMKNVLCPTNLLRALRAIFESEKKPGYKILREVIRQDVEEDEDGNVINGDPDCTVIHTLYRYVVLFGIPECKSMRSARPRVWKALDSALSESSTTTTTTADNRLRSVVVHRNERRTLSDIAQYRQHRKLYSLETGTMPLIANARKSLGPSGMDLLSRLCHFDPSRRATALDVLNSPFMKDLREPEGSSIEIPAPACQYNVQVDEIRTYGALSTTTSALSSSGLGLFRQM